MSADNADSSVGVHGRVPSSGSLSTKTISERSLEKPTSGYTPTHPGVGEPLDILSI